MPFTKYLLILSLTLLAVSLHSRTILFTPDDSVTLGMKLADFQRMYTTDTMCIWAPNKNTYTYIQTSDNLYQMYRMVTEKSYLTFLNGHLIQCYTVVNDSASMRNIRTRLYLNRYQCLAGSVCTSFRLRKRRVVSCVLFGNKTATVDHHTKRMEHYHLPVNPLIPVQN